MLLLLQELLLLDLLRLGLKLLKKVSEVDLRNLIWLKLGYLGRRLLIHLVDVWVDQHVEVHILGYLLVLLHQLEKEGLEL